MHVLVSFSLLRSSLDDFPIFSSNLLPLSSPYFVVYSSALSSCITSKLNIIWLYEIFPFMTVTKQSRLSVYNPSCSILRNIVFYRPNYDDWASHDIVSFRFFLTNSVTISLNTRFVIHRLYVDIVTVFIKPFGSYASLHNNLE